MLLTRLPLTPKGPLDLHVLGLPPAFVLSQDQTLKFNPNPLAFSEFSVPAKTDTPNHRKAKPKPKVPIPHIPAKSKHAKSRHAPRPEPTGSHGFHLLKTQQVKLHTQDNSSQHKAANHAPSKTDKPPATLPSIKLSKSDRKAGAQKDRAPAYRVLSLEEGPKPRWHHPGRGTPSGVKGGCQTLSRAPEGCALARAVKMSKGPAPVNAKITFFRFLCAGPLC